VPLTYRVAGVLENNPKCTHFSIDIYPDDAPQCVESWQMTARQQVVCDELDGHRYYGVNLDKVSPLADIGTTHFVDRGGVMMIWASPRK